MDSRYDRKSTKDDLPDWIKRSLKTCTNLTESLELMEKVNYLYFYFLLHYNLNNIFVASSLKQKRNLKITKKKLCTYYCVVRMNVKPKDKPNSNNNVVIFRWMLN